MLCLSVTWADHFEENCQHYFDAHKTNNIHDKQFCCLCLPPFSSCSLLFNFFTRLYAASPRAALPRHDERPRLRRVGVCRDIVCHTVAGIHAGTYVPRLILGCLLISGENSKRSRRCYFKGYFGKIAFEIAPSATLTVLTADHSLTHCCA